ncbi:MAG TPA: hypothetical protein VLY84_00090 [Dysgonamonadaceae bacterium]|nr:hypothetical protein [Dysgonamonadaceae bacterium]
MKTHYYNEVELIKIFAAANSIDEIFTIAERLKWLWALGENIDLSVVNTISNVRIRDLA